LAVRRAYILEDVRECLYRAILKLTTSTAPWTSWAVTNGWPETDLMEQYTKLIIFLDAPLVPDLKKRHAGGLPSIPISIMVGAWNDISTGGLEENNIAISHIVEQFLNPKTLNQITFNVTLGSTTYTATTLIAQGIRISNVFGPRNLDKPDSKEYRRELELVINTN